MAKDFGIKDLTEEEMNLIKTEKDVVSAMGRIISARSHIAWTTGGHVGGDIGLYSYSTAEKAERLIGTVHNYEIGRYLEDVLDLDLEAKKLNLADLQFTAQDPYMFHKKLLTQ